MALSEMQTFIVDGFKLCGANYEDALTAVVKLQTEEQQWEMLDYLEEAVSTPPGREAVVNKLKEIIKE